MDIGTTEEGSSGGPLFNNSYQLIGTLTGGSANCAYPVNDYYAIMIYTKTGETAEYLSKCNLKL